MRYSTCLTNTRLTNTRLTMALLALAGAAAACTDAPAGPSVPPAAAPRSALLTGTTEVGHDGRLTLTVNPAKEQTFRIGRHKIVFPANSICDPARSSYGPTEWDKPCKALNTPITITADTMTIDGHPFIAFSPELRFAPSRNAEQWVVLFMEDRNVADESVASSLNILWQAPDGTLVDESLADPTMATKVQTRGISDATVNRRIKHFSGYLVATRAGTTEAQAAQ
jgi:hypothetical protein